MPLLALVVTATWGGHCYPPPPQKKAAASVNLTQNSVQNMANLTPDTNVRSQLNFKNVTTPTCPSRWLASYLAGKLNICLRDTQQVAQHHEGPDCALESPSRNTTLLPVLTISHSF